MTLHLPATAGPPALATGLHAQALLAEPVLARADATPALEGIVLDQAPSPAQLAALSRRLGVELALVHHLGGSGDPAAGRYVLYTGTAHGVTAPLGAGHRLLCHTELAGGRVGPPSSRDVAYLGRAAALGAVERQSAIVRVSGRGGVDAVIEFGAGSAWAPARVESAHRYTAIDPAHAVDLARDLSMLGSEGHPLRLPVFATPGRVEFARLAQADEGFPEQVGVYSNFSRRLQNLFGDLKPWNGMTAYPAYVLEILKPGTRVLDVGCGLGWLVNDLRERGVDAYGLDPSDAMPEGPHLVRAGVQDKDAFPAEHFDTILSSHSIFNRDETEGFRLAALARLAYWLKPGGTLHLGTVIDPKGLARMAREDVPGLRPVIVEPCSVEQGTLMVNGYLFIIKDGAPG